MPTHAPRSSTTGTRRISFSSMVRQHSSSDMSGVTVTIARVMQSAAVKSRGLRSLAIVRQTMSRSVMTPIGSLLAVFSITGISPQSFTTISRATSGREVSLVQHAGFAVIISFTCIILYLHFQNLFAVFLRDSMFLDQSANNCETGSGECRDSLSFMSSLLLGRGFLSRNLTSLLASL